MVIFLCMRWSVLQQLGGLLFDREVRAIVGYLSQVSEWGVREQLTRLTQMATLLNLENLAEVSVNLMVVVDKLILIIKKLELEMKLQKSVADLRKDY